MTVEEENKEWEDKCVICCELLGDDGHYAWLCYACGLASEPTASKWALAIPFKDLGFE